MTEPRRLLDDPETADALRAALEAGRELPDEAQLASLASRLGPLLGPGGGGGGSGGSSAATGGGGAAIKASLGLLAAAAATAGIVWWSASGEPHEPSVSRPAVEQEVAPAVPAPDIPEGVDVPEDLVLAPEPEIAPRRARSRSDPTPTFEIDPEAEMQLIRRAQDALATSPRTALARAEEHRRRFGEGTLAQEREVVAIDALVREGREPEARERADAFHRRWPRSAHRRRIDVLVPPR